MISAVGTPAGFDGPLHLDPQDIFLGSWFIRDCFFPAVSGDQLLELRAANLDSHKCGVELGPSSRKLDCQGAKNPRCFVLKLL